MQVGREKVIAVLLTNGNQRDIPWQRVCDLYLFIKIVFQEYIPFFSIEKAVIDPNNILMKG